MLLLGSRSHWLINFTADISWVCAMVNWVRLRQPMMCRKVQAVPSLMSLQGIKVCLNLCPSRNDLLKNYNPSAKGFLYGVLHMGDISKRHCHVMSSGSVKFTFAPHRVWLTRRNFCTSKCKRRWWQNLIVQAYLGVTNRFWCFCDQRCLCSLSAPAVLLMERLEK